MEKTRCQSCFREYEGTECPNCGHPKNGQNASHQLPVGSILRSRYQIGRVLGQGGYGITYLCWDTQTQKLVAVKEFFPEGLVFRKSESSIRVECVTDRVIPYFERTRARFLREASALVKFQEIPEVVGIHDFIEENNTAYIVMEYVRGVELAEYVRIKGGKLTPDETFRILKPVMEALAKIHKGGIIHRDISPDNIILDPMGGAKLLDFGAVRSVEDPDVEKALTRSTEAILKHGFAPLEQYNSRGSLGPWTDEYAMCATIWYCLTGKIPMEASTRMTEGIAPDWSTIPDLPAHQQKALEKGFACRPKDRYRTVDELLEALFLSHIPSDPGPEMSAAGSVKAKSPKEKRKQKKHSLLLGIAGGIAALAVIAVTMTLLVFAPNQKYIQAERFLKNGNYRDAIGIFEELGGYNDSADRIPEAYYRWAEALLAEGAYQQAIDIYTSLGDYKDCADRIPDACYRWAEALLTEEEYQQAIDIFTSLGDYKDCADRIPDTYYRWAEALLTKEMYPEAIDIFTSLGDYKDSADRIPDARYRWAEALLTKEMYPEAIDILASLGDYNGSAERLPGIYYYWASQLKADGLLGEAAIAFGRSGEYSDARDQSFAIWDQIAVRDTLAGGYDHTVGLRTDGRVVAAGSHFYRACDVTHWTDIVAVAAGYNFTLGAKADGTVVATGDNSWGQCNVSGWSDIVAIAAGAEHAVGLKADGTVVAVGNNNSFQCDVADWSNIVAIAASSSRTVGLKADGTVVAVGSNFNGACNVNGWSDIVGIFAGCDHTLGLKADGTVVTVGYNSYGQGNVKTWTDIVQVSAGNTHTLGVKANGSVVATGWNRHGQCNVISWSDIVAVAAGPDHSIGLRSDGTLVTVGRNDHGQCNVTGWSNIRQPYDRSPFR